MNQKENQGEKSHETNGDTSFTAAGSVIGGRLSGKERDAPNNGLQDGSAVSEGANGENDMNVEHNLSNSVSKPEQPSSNSPAPSRSGHQDSVNDAAPEIKSVAPSLDDSTEPATRVMEETPPQGPPSVAAVDSSSSDAVPITITDEAGKKERASENKTAEVTGEPSNAKEDMDIDEMNTGSPSKNSEEMRNSDNLNGKQPNNGAKMERRTSKRQRSSSSNRFEPGEGGGLASKKPRVIDGIGATGPPNVSTDEAPKLQPNLEPSTGSSSAKAEGAGSNGGKDGAKTTDLDNAQQRNGGNESSKQTEWSEPIYRWIDEGGKSIATPSLVEHQGLEIDFTNSKTTTLTSPPTFVVRPGDMVLISSGDSPWDNANKKNAPGSQKHQAKREGMPIYNDPASRDAGLGALDPFIGYVERLWEEGEDSPKKGTGQRKKKSTTKSSRMMIRTRWFFKKEELEGLKGSFVVEGGSNYGGSAKEEILESMASQDLVLTDQSDDNTVSAILGKVKVVKRKPLTQSVDVDMTVPKGGFVCRYDLSFLAESSEDEGMVKFFPCSDDSDFKVSTSNDSTTKSLESKDIDMSEPSSTDDGGDSSARLVGHNNYDAPLPFPLSPRRVVSEGATTVGKIKIGPNHQAVIPPQLDLEKKTSFRGLAHPPSQRIPTMVWDPATDEDVAVDGFLEEACSLLSDHMKLIELEPFHDVNYVECPNVKAEAKKPREANIDRMLTELHECKGDVRRAIKKISSNPEKYMTIWNKNDKDQFDTSYRTYRESIRMIANSLGGSKSCKDTVDYQYRFKLVENFRRFKMKKRVKAEEIMATVEDRMLNEKVKAEAKSQEAIETDISSSEEEEGKVSAIASGNVGSLLTAVPATHAGPVNIRIRTWFRTGGGGEDAVGATQQRRNHACDLLSQVKEKVGKEGYDTLAKSLKACNSSQATNNSLADVKTAAQDIMKSHPDLLERFINFLPKEVRSN